MSALLRGLATAALALAVIASALASVYVVDEHRRTLRDLQAARTDRDALLTAWERLRIEHGTLAAYDEVERRARKAFAMQVPPPAEVVVLGVGTGAGDGR
ncbi:MAG: cell division protein FtsL [Chromatiales bacterium]|nr:cell division protein FtsL [Chromatiales bacterium]